jgi:hypothetical protein
LLQCAAFDVGYARSALFEDSVGLLGRWGGLIRLEYIANFTCSARGKMCFVSVRALCSLWDWRCLPQVARCLMLGALCVVAVYAPIRTGYCDTCSGRGSFMLMPAAGGWRQCRDHLLVN